MGAAVPDRAVADQRIGIFAVYMDAAFFDVVDRAAFEISFTFGIDFHAGSPTRADVAIYDIGSAFVGNEETAVGSFPDFATPKNPPATVSDAAPDIPAFDFTIEKIRFSAGENINSQHVIEQAASNESAGRPLFDLDTDSLAIPNIATVKPGVALAFDLHAGGRFGRDDASPKLRRPTGHAEAGELLVGILREFYS